jgi:hypothetical protein
MFIGLGYLKVLVGAVGAEEGGAESHLHDILSEAFEKINGPSDACVLSESYQTTVVFVSDFFVVDQPNFEFKHFVQSRHVVRLGLKLIRRIL